MSSKPVLKIDWASYESARFACERWHYSRCVPNQKTVRLGAWEGGVFVGCVIFGDGSNPGLVAPYGLGPMEGCELVRIALGPHAHPVTKIAAVALKMMRTRCPKIRLVMSFADPEQGHHGGVYQGGNWIYLGETDAADEYIVNGRRMHGRALRSTRKTHRRGHEKARNVEDWARLVIDPNIKRIAGSSKHRYAFPFDEDLRARLMPHAKPYPKRLRAGSADNGTLADQAGGDGAVPIPALHLDEVDDAS